MLNDYSSVLCLVLLLISFTIGTADGAQYIRNPAPDFSRHSIVQPVVLHGRTKREISTTRDMNEAHHPEVTIIFPIDGEADYIFDLRLNQDLITDNHTLSYQENGTNFLYKPKKEEIDLCHYSGLVRDEPGSWVAVSTCHGIQGIIFDGERMRYIEPAQDGDLSSQHYVYDHSDLIDANVRKHVHNRVRSSSGSRRMKRRMSRSKRSADSNIHGPYNANEKSFYVELALVASSDVYGVNNKDKKRVHHKMLMVANYLNGMFSPLNIFIAVVGVEVWETDRISIDNNAGVTLSHFREYKNRILKKKIPHDNAHLLVQRSFDGGVVGMAFGDQDSSTMCSEHSCGFSYYNPENVALTAMTMAHEMGHNFGMGHDAELHDKCVCTGPGNACIMSANEYTSHWSSCSLKTIESFRKKKENHCLWNKPKSLFDSPTCGNGFVEPGEQCDCGTMPFAGTYHPCHACCDPNTCMFRVYATCFAGMCCDLQTCRIKSRGAICRAAQECDLPEYCDGRSEYCPDDVYVMNTARRCKKPEMMCMNKKCVNAYNHSMPDSMTCSSGCSGQGVCNSKGHCHCEVGYGSPNCAVAGPGGSYDSGPATDDTSSTNFMIAMYAIFLGIIPALLVSILLFVSRHNILKWYEDYYQRRLSDKFGRPVNTLSNTGGVSNSPTSSNFENVNNRTFSCKSISIPIQKITPAKLDININKDNVDLTETRDLKISQTMVKTTLNVNRLSNETPNATDLSHRNGFNKPSLQTKPSVNEPKNCFKEAISLVKLKPIAYNSSNKNLSRKVKTEPRDNLSNKKSNATNLSKENEPEVKPPIKSKPSVINLSKEKSNLSNLINKNNPEDKPPMKPKPNMSSLSREIELKQGTIKGMVSSMTEIMTTNQDGKSNIRHNVLPK